MQSVTLQDILLAVADVAGDLTRGRTTNSITSPSTNMQDSSKATNGRDRYWENSQVFFLQPAGTSAGQSSTDPFTVRNFVTADGTFVLDRSFSSSGGVPAGLDYAIVRTQGRGFPYSRYLLAIRHALDKLDIASEVSDSSVLATRNGVLYTLPSTLDTVYDVAISHPSQGRLLLAPNQWELTPGRGLRLATGLAARVDTGWPLIVSGRKFARHTNNLTDILTVPLDEVTDAAVEFLLRASNRAQDQGKAGNLTQERVRFSRMYVYPNEQEII